MNDIFILRQIPNEFFKQRAESVAIRLYIEPNLLLWPATCYINGKYLSTQALKEVVFS